MQTPICRWLWAISLLAAGMLTAADAEHAANLLTARDTQGKLLCWPDIKRQPAVDAAGKAAIRIEGGNSVAPCVVMLKAEWKTLHLQAQIRTSGIVGGEQPWQEGRIAMRFYDRDGKEVGDWPEMFSFRGDVPWTACERTYVIPAGAAKLSISPANFGKSGIFEVSGMVLTASSVLRSAKDAPSPVPGADSAKLWELKDAYRQTTATREQYSLNGLWQFYPVLDLRKDTAGIPADGTGWCWFKVPGIWPGVEGWTAPGNAQKIYYFPGSMLGIPESKLNNAWYRRTIAVPESWSGRRIEIGVTMLQTCAQVFVDGKAAGEFYYPGGRLDLSGHFIPGKTHTLALLVAANPAEGAAQKFMAPGRLITVSSQLNCRGINGDMFIESLPKAGTITDAHIITSLRQKRLTIDAGMADVAPGEYYLAADICDGGQIVKNFRSQVFTITPDDKRLRKQFAADWLAPKLWDTDTPQNLYTANVRLCRTDDVAVDELYPQEFGFREFWTEGRNLYLNGSCIHLRALASYGTLKGADIANAGAARHAASFARSEGFNFLIGYDYDFAPGTVGYADAFHHESSRLGVLTSLTLPHAKDFKWNLKSPEQSRRYRQYTEELIRRFQNVPGIVMYVMNHNAAGYYGDQNPQKIDGVYKPETQGMAPGQWCATAREQAGIAEKIAKSIDATRPVYHHQSGNLGDLFTVNCYLNWAPRQERSDWLEHWETAGRMPLFFVEWGMPHMASWSSYRGPGFIWNADGVQCLWFDEYNAAILGESAYRQTPGKIELARKQEKICKNDSPIHFSQINGLPGELDAHRVRNYMMADNVRAMRARGISGLLPWDFGLFWYRDGVPAKESSGENPHRFTDIKRPGIVADVNFPFGEPLLERGSTFKRTLTGQGALPYMRDMIGWIAGKAGDFTEKGCNFLPGEIVHKQLLAVNDTRKQQKIQAEWQVAALKAGGKLECIVAPGERGEMPFSFTIPAGQTAGPLDIEAVFLFPNGEQIKDTLNLNVIAPPRSALKCSLGVYDPSGESTPLLNSMGLNYRKITVPADLAGVELLVIGRNSLPAVAGYLRPALEQGLRVLILEQSYDTLRALGFRAHLHGLREVFSLNQSFKNLHDWRGRSTAYPEYIHTDSFETHDPLWNWNGFENTRVWRAGNRGVVNGVLLEKPMIGNFLPLLHGGFDLQYTPLVELREGRGMVTFCQLDVSARTEAEPEAAAVVAQALTRLAAHEPAAARKVYYAGGSRGKELLKNLRIRFNDWTGQAGKEVLIIAASGYVLRPEIKAAVEKGVCLFALGLNAAELAAVLPDSEKLTPAAGYNDCAAGLRETPEFAGISNAELHWRAELPFAAFPADGAGGRALRAFSLGAGRVVALQAAPWMLSSDYQYRTTSRRMHYLVARLLHNLRAESEPGIFALFDCPQENGEFVLGLSNGWSGIADKHNSGHTAGFWKPDYQPSADWRAVQTGTAWESQFADLHNYDGMFWYRKTFSIPHPLREDAEYVLQLGKIDDESWVWLNGNFLGEITAQSNPADYWAFPRQYSLRAGDLRPQNNVLTILCNDLRGGGGILGTPKLQAKIQPKIKLYTDKPIAADDPYRYYRW